ncbi:flagellar brake protein [Piscinibacter sp.]|uniref:flagellar brake protein n=1 Tax=Piscinibacter sp. TaxID=1903157 RepID=UPI002C5B4F9F|nr:flagellar regulator YcgR PilZN domain-containing protein [Albitalea sp.]HUG22551.1 flagellar regulator YcgR PilZN domain-containing protein [Albitalea sp.]
MTDRLDDFRITAPAEIAALLKQLADQSVHLSLNAPNGSSITVTVWTVDAARGKISFSAVADDPQLNSLVDCDEAVAVGYLESVKLQFDVDDLVLVRAGAHSALNGAFPSELFRFQRRNGFRVSPMLRTTPVARLRHPMIPDMQLGLRVLDVSIGGCALFLPDDVPPLDPGVLLNGVTLELDADTRVATSLRLHHVTAFNPDSRGVRLGCEMVSPGSDGVRALQRYIDLTQKRRRMLAAG